MRKLLLIPVLFLSGCATVYERCQANFYGLGYHDYPSCVQGEQARAAQAAAQLQQFGQQMRQRSPVTCDSYQWGNGVRTECH